MREDGINKGERVPWELRPLEVNRTSAFFLSRHFLKPDQTFDFV